MCKVKKYEKFFNETVNAKLRKKEKEVGNKNSFINPYPIYLQGFPVSRELWEEE